MSSKKPETKKSQSTATRARPVAKKPRSSARNVAPSANDWHSVWLRAVARAWREPKFEKALLEDPRKALKSEFDFDLPKGVNLRVVAGSSKGAKDAAEFLKSADVELALPPKPSSVEDHAVALASLTDTNGRSNCCGSPCC